MLKKIMTGNEAIARGAWEAGCHVAAAYPGTPSSEILENIAQYKEIYSEWSTNEKVALEVAAGASIAGARSMAAMKHVGLNVAADPLFTMSYIGANGGLVVITADDPGLFSSQNEQDNRWYALHAKLPMFEPTDSQECKDFLKAAFDLSEKFDAPVLFRVTTRICHSKTIVELGERAEAAVKPYERNPSKNIMAPAPAKARHYFIEEREKKLREFSETCPYNTIEWAQERKIGVIATGISYQHARDAFEDRSDRVSFLKLGFTYPLPEKLIRTFAGGVETLYVVEENEPYVETFVKSLGIACVGRAALPAVDELNAGIVRAAFVERAPSAAYSVEATPPPRPSVLCPGCTHRGVFYAMTKYKDIAVTGDIGCYTLGMMPPLGVMDSVICMGASISAGVGFQKALEFKAKSGQDSDSKKDFNSSKKIKKVFGVIGDSTFFHSGITGLIDAVMNKSGMALCILDNRTTAMTGHQQNPGTGFTLGGEPTQSLSLKALCVACGVKEENIRTIDPYDLKATEQAVKEAYEAKELFVIIATQPCALIKDVLRRRANVRCQVDSSLCVQCKACMKVGCPALSFKAFSSENGAGKIQIEASMCNGCTVCAQVCPKKAISQVGEFND